MNCFEEIRNRLDIRTVAEYYGIEIKRNNTCLCPFHDDHHPSAHIYPNAFHCFTCNVHYDILGFVMELSGLSAIDAAKKTSVSASDIKKSIISRNIQKLLRFRRISERNVNALKNGNRKRGRQFTIIYGSCVTGLRNTSHHLMIHM